MKSVCIDMRSVVVRAAAAAAMTVYDGHYRADLIP